MSNPSTPWPNVERWYVDRVAGVDRAKVNSPGRAIDVDRALAPAGAAGERYLNYVRDHQIALSERDDQSPIFDPPLDEDPIARQLLVDFVQECSAARTYMDKDLKVAQETPPGLEYLARDAELASSVRRSQELLFASDLHEFWVISGPPVEREPFIRRAIEVADTVGRLQSSDLAFATLLANYSEIDRELTRFHGETSRLLDGDGRKPGLTSQLSEVQRQRKELESLQAAQSRMFDIPRHAKALGKLAVVADVVAATTQVFLGSTWPEVFSNWAATGVGTAVAYGGTLGSLFGFKRRQDHSGRFRQRGERIRALKLEEQNLTAAIGQVRIEGAREAPLVGAKRQLESKIASQFLELLPANASHVLGANSVLVPETVEEARTSRWRHDVAQILLADASGDADDLVTPTDQKILSMLRLREVKQARSLTDSDSTANIEAPVDARSVESGPDRSFGVGL